MPSPVAARRVEIFSGARADLAGFVRLEPSRLRYALGTSLADLTVPLLVATDARAIIHGAAAQVALLLSIHHRFVPADERDRLMLREDYGTLPPISPRLGPESGGPDLRGAARLGPAIHPALTGGVVSAWMGKGGKGRSLVALWIELLRRGFVEMAAERDREETPLLVAIALGAESAATDQVIREALPGSPLDRYLRAAARSALWIAARTGLARAWRDTDRAADDPLLARIEAALSPGPLLGGRAAVLAGGSTLYGCELAAGVPRAEELQARLSAGADPSAIAADLGAAIGADGELERRAELAVAVARLRETIASAVIAAEAAGQGARAAPLRELLAAPGALSAAAADDPGRKQLLRVLSQAELDGGPAERLTVVQEALRNWKPKEPAAAFGAGHAAARDEYASAAVALLCDLVLDRIVGTARRSLSFRTGGEAEGGADVEWEAGRLYRLSARPGPILRTLEERPVAHLFVDVKDFTRRTVLVGQASMAEFLRREFYLPILAAAKEHFGGMGHLPDRGGISLNNLLGDAITFSGRIDTMVAVARAIRRQLAAYGVRLARNAGTVEVANRIAAIEASYAAALAPVARARAEAEAEAARVPPGSAQRAMHQARAAQLAAEAARLGEERDRALALARGEGLEAGVFISYGPAPLVVITEDEVFGRNRVAIADKINESARGTARAPAARFRADAALARERAAQGKSALRHAFQVFTGQPLQIAVPPDVEAAALRAVRAGDLQAGMRALAAPVRDALDAAARQGDERPGDIYNGGAALSEDALLAFLGEVEGDREVRRVEVEPEQIPEALRSRWFYGDSTLSLVACFSEGSRVAELFRRVGVAVFKGLGHVVVWELCSDEGGPAALADALGAAWLRGG